MMRTCTRHVLVHATVLLWNRGTPIETAAIICGSTHAWAYVNAMLHIFFYSYSFTIKQFYFSHIPSGLRRALGFKLFNPRVLEFSQSNRASQVVLKAGFLDLLALQNGLEAFVLS